MKIPISILENWLLKNYMANNIPTEKLVMSKCSCKVCDFSAGSFRPLEKPPEQPHCRNINKARYESNPTAGSPHSPQHLPEVAQILFRSLLDYITGYKDQMACVLHLHFTLREVLNRLTQSIGDVSVSWACLAGYRAEKGSEPDLLIYCTARNAWLSMER